MSINENMNIALLFKFEPICVSSKFCCHSLKFVGSISSESLPALPTKVSHESMNFPSCCILVGETYISVLKQNHSGVQYYLNYLQEGNTLWIWRPTWGMTSRKFDNQQQEYTHKTWTREVEVDGTKTPLPAPRNRPQDPRPLKISRLPFQILSTPIHTQNSLPIMLTIQT